MKQKLRIMGTGISASPEESRQVFVVLVVHDVAHFVVHRQQLVLGNRGTLLYSVDFSFNIHWINFMTKLNEG